MQASRFWVLLDQPLTQPSVVDAQKATKALKRLRIQANQPAGICVRLSAAIRRRLNNRICRVRPSRLGARAMTAARPNEGMKRLGDHGGRLTCPPGRDLLVLEPERQRGECACHVHHCRLRLVSERAVEDQGVQPPPYSRHVRDPSDRQQRSVDVALRTPPVS